MAPISLRPGIPPRTPRWSPETAAANAARLFENCRLSDPRGFALVEMIGQRQRHAVAQRRSGRFVAGVQEDASVAAIAQFPGVELAESRDQIGLAMEINRVLVNGGFYTVDPD